MNPLEKQILLSLAIIRTIGNQQKTTDEQAKQIQKLNQQRRHLLTVTNMADGTVSTADKTRISLIQFLLRLAEKKIRQEI